MDIVQVFDYIVMAISILLVRENLKRFMWSSRSIYFLFFFALYVFPIFLDYIIEFQQHYHWGFIVASNDAESRVIYDILILLIMLFLIYYKNKNPKVDFVNNLSKYNTRTKIKFGYERCLYIFSFFPIVATLILIREPYIMCVFQWREYGIFEISQSYSTIEKFTYFGVLCSVLLFFNHKKRFFHYSKLIALAGLYMNVCIQGKRSILFFSIMVIIIVLLYRYLSLKAQRKSTFVFIITFFCVSTLGLGYMIYSSIQVKVDRGYSETADKLLYTSTRIDLFREDRIKMAIYSELNPEKIKILDYKCQSLYSNFVSIVPLNYISEPLDLSEGSYQTHFSMAMFNRPYNYIEKKKNRNYMTCTIFAELISNFGIVLGTLFMIIILNWFIKITDKYPNPYNIFIVVSFVLLNLFDFTYIVVFLELTCLFCYLYRKK